MMTVRDYIDDRDIYIATQVYAAFKDKVQSDYEARCYEIALQAVKAASEQWLSNTGEEYAHVLDYTPMPESSIDDDAS